MKNVGESLFKKLSYFVLTLIAGLTVFFAFQIPNIKFDYNFEDFFPKHDSETDYFFNHRERFESDNDFIVIAVENQEGILDSTFLRKIHTCAEEIESVPSVKWTRDITHEKERFIYPGGMTGSRPYIDFQDLDLKRDSSNIFENQELVNTLVNKKGTALAIFVRHNDYLAKKKSEKLVGQIEKIIAKYNFDEVHVAGRIVGQIFYINTMTEEMGLYVGLSMVLVVLFLLFAFRSVWGLMVPLIVIIASMIWIVGFMAWIDAPINILLTILPSIIFVVGMSDVIHLVSKYFELLRQKYDKFTSIKIAFKEIGMATFLTSLTTSVGFFSLWFVNVKPIQNFGIFVGIGVLMTFIITFSVLPFLFYHTGVPKVVKDKSSSFWFPVMRNIFLFTIRKRKLLPWISILVIIVFSYGASRIVVNNYLMDDMDPDIDIKQSFNYIDKDFGGVRPFEMAVTLTDSTKSLWDTEVLKKIEQVEVYLKNEYGVDIKNSLVHSVRILNRAKHAGDTSYFKVPDSQREIKSIRKVLRMADRGKYIRRIVDSTGYITRISGTIPDWGNIRSRKENDSLRQFIEENVNTKELDFRVTGSAHLLDKNMRYMSGSLVRGLGTAILIVALIMGLLYKSLRVVIISIIPNIIPLVVIAGIMGFFGINLKITTAIVFTISFGIAVDDTIHFLSQFKLELDKGKSVIYALKRTYLVTGKAIVLTSVILISGFLLLLLSDFLGTFYMGLMICITLFVAILADFFVLPLLLLFWYKKR
ncbi:MAG: MMPL family transporter [Brumimicrobium sp.]|nr:MMPL family transporter [Brumimicrobium sp.]